MEQRLPQSPPRDEMLRSSEDRSPYHTRAVHVADLLQKNGVQYPMSTLRHMFYLKIRDAYITSKK